MYIVKQFEAGEILAGDFSLVKERKMTTSKVGNRFFIIGTIIFGVLTLSASSCGSGDVATIASKDAELAAANARITALNTKVTSLQNDLTTLNSTFTTTKGQLDLTLSQLKTANAYIDTVQSQVTNATAQTASIKSENDRLQRIIDLKEASVKATSITVRQNEGVVSSIVSFTAAYAGYVVVSATSSAPSGYALVTDDNPMFQFSTTEYKIVNGSSFSVPVLPGGVGIYFGNKEKLTNEYNGTFSVTYYY
jgi:peptidoglycan hydrolase CwlO-like protein